MWVSAKNLVRLEAQGVLGKCLIVQCLKRDLVRLETQVSPRKVPDCPMPQSGCLPRHGLRECLSALTLPCLTSPRMSAYERV